MHQYHVLRCFSDQNNCADDKEKEKIENIAETLEFIKVDAVILIIRLHIAHDNA